MINSMLYVDIRFVALWAWLALAAAPSGCIGCMTLPVIELSVNWTLQNLNGSVSLHTSVPGYALQALHARGLLDEPLSGYDNSER